MYLFIYNFIKNIIKDIHWIIISSFERDQDIPERMQAVKVMKKFMTIMPEHFPTAFVRSLIAVSSVTDDSFRRISIEILRELSLINSQVVQKCYGFRALMEAAIDPALQDISETILVSILQLVSNPKPGEDTRFIFDQRVLV